MRSWDSEKEDFDVLVGEKYEYNKAVKYGRTMKDL